MTRKEIDKLRAQQSDQEKQLDTAREEAERLAKAEEPIPEELQTRATKARDAVVSIGEQIVEAELAFSRSLSRTASFWPRWHQRFERRLLRRRGAMGRTPRSRANRWTCSRSGCSSSTAARCVTCRITSRSTAIRSGCAWTCCAARTISFPSRAGEFLARQRRITAKGLRHDRRRDGRRHRTRAATWSRTTTRSCVKSRWRSWPTVA